MSTRCWRPSRRCKRRGIAWSERLRKGPFTCLTSPSLVRCIARQALAADQRWFTAWLAQVGPHRTVAFPHRVRRRAGGALVGGPTVHALSGHRERPAMQHALQPPVGNPTRSKRPTLVRAVGVEQTETPILVAKQHQRFSQQSQPQRAAPDLRRSVGRCDRQPVPSQRLPNRSTATRVAQRSQLACTQQPIDLRGAIPP